MALPINMDEEARLYTTNAQREKVESMATLFGIIVALDYLERAYVRDSITAAQYTPACTRLLAQYKTMLKLVPEEVPSLEAFMRRYNMDAPAAAHRLSLGIPATVEHASSSSDSSDSPQRVAETTQNFITFMDALRLEMRAKDQLHPLLTELMDGYSKFKGSAGWEGRSKIVGWLITLNGMKASESLSDEQVRQLLFDIERAYNEFFRSLSGKSGDPNS
ncbi:vacuolar protein sorting-associated protein 28 [Calocera viscosa TUFC12733]|uniref:Vacuolar protein sorting-associated protein 28 n=1 Tax=Calocera viscosa (strain TUFC12733) TaxID=1330018 RepID=A0A167IQ74_CALVF|nr:vacuolar protein sorting-associated protein 28 [Calocera viscosa TUFC12733]